MSSKEAPDYFSVLVSSLRKLVRIAYAFTMSDYKTIIGPVMCYALMSAPILPYSHLPALLAWVWLHLLQFCAANQMFSSQEDAINKPYRPIPAGLIKIETTQILRWALMPICLGLSWKLQVLYPGISLSLAFIVYNEFGLDSYWYTKNILNAIGIVSWNVGAAAIAGRGISFPDSQVWLAPYISTVLIASTIHVQDFRDEKGDRLQGRITFPVVMPLFSRYISFFLIVIWSMGLVYFWGVSLPIAASFLVFGLYLATRILILRLEQDDKVSLRYYMAWLCMGQVLPFVVNRMGTSQ